jgi:DNA-binding transcriptional LysR family regulator
MGLNNMTLSQLRYFLALCDEKSFTGAARRCTVSQPSLTNAIKALEGELGGALFHRKPRARLTGFGRALRPNFRLIIKAADRATQTAAALIDGTNRKHVFDEMPPRLGR